MADIKTVIEQAYFAFNKRDMDGALALMVEGVSWPKASESGKIVGKEEIRAYWTRQWAAFDPHVEPLAITKEHGGRVRVRVHHSSRTWTGTFFPILRLFTCSTWTTAVSQRWISELTLIQAAHQPQFHIDPN